MGNTNSCIRHLKDVVSSLMGGSSLLESEESGECSTSMSVEEQIEKSKSHWSTLADQADQADQAGGMEEGEECAEESNVHEFQALQSHPVWGGFFQTFGYDLNGRYRSMGEMEVGAKFAEGGQAELFHALVTWWYPEANERVRRQGTEFVLKVFKKGTFLKHLISQMPLGLLQFHAQTMENSESPTPQVVPRWHCKVHRGTLLKDGRFAFLMEKEHLDLRNLIERNMKSRICQKHGPFLKEDSELIMYYVALGVNWLHIHGIVHRDLKASNVLVKEDQSRWPKWLCVVADYECSVGVVGTGFFRAPEILQVLKDRSVSQNPEVFSTAADVYSFGMTCYEILTGKLPFEDHPLKRNSRVLIDHVINQHLRPEVPDYVEDWTHDLLTRCWQSNHVDRPTLEEILDLLSVNSTVIRKEEAWLLGTYGDNFRRGLSRTKIPNT